MTPHPETQRKLTLYRGVYPVNFVNSSTDPAVVLKDAANELMKRGAAGKDDLVILTIGEPLAKAGGTNSLKLVRIRDL